MFCLLDIWLMFIVKLYLWQSIRKTKCLIQEKKRVQWRDFLVRVFALLKWSVSPSTLNSILFNSTDNIIRDTLNELGGTQATDPLVFLALLRCDFLVSPHEQDTVFKFSGLHFHLFLHFNILVARKRSGYFKCLFNWLSFSMLFLASCRAGNAQVRFFLIHYYYKVLIPHSFNSWTQY